MSKFIRVQTLGLVYSRNGGGVTEGAWLWINLDFVVTCYPGGRIYFSDGNKIEVTKESIETLIRIIDPQD